MKKRILGILLSLALMIGMMPVLGLSQTAYADDVTNYDLWVGGTQVTSANKDDVFNDQKVSYTPATDTSAAILKLNDYNNEGAVGDKYAGIYAEGNLIIETTGNNTISNNAAGDRLAINVFWRSDF